jgi:hypothetical protein
MSDDDTDPGRINAEPSRVADENTRLRQINRQMLQALQFSLPILQAGLPVSGNFDAIREAVAKVQNAIAEAERDPWGGS